MTAVLKKGERYSKDKLIPIRILPNVPKVFEKCMFRQMSNYMDNFLSKHQSSFRKEYNTQYWLLKMFEKWKSAVNKANLFGALSTDLLLPFSWFFAGKIAFLWV